MATIKQQIKIPEAIMTDLELKDGDVVEVSVKERTAVIKASNEETGRQTISLRFFLIPSLIASIVFLLYFYYFKIFEVPMTGTNSLAQMVIVLGEISGMTAFTTAYITNNRTRRLPSRKTFWRIFPTMFIAFAIILAFIASVFFWAVGYMFEGVSFDVFTAAGIFLIFNSIVNYLMIYSALSINMTFISTLFISTFIGGAIAAIVTNSSRQWWQHNVSFLGTNQALNAWQFNLTVIVSALLWIALIDYMFVPFMASHKGDWRLMTLRTLLTVAAIALLGIGIFPNNGGIWHTLHTQSAWFLEMLVVLLIVCVRWLLPGVSKEFLSTSYTVAGIIIFAAILFKGINYLSLTAFEMIVFALAASWILLLLQNIHRLNHNDDTSILAIVSAEHPEE